MISPVLSHSSQSRNMLVDRRPRSTSKIYTNRTTLATRTPIESRSYTGIPRNRDVSERSPDTYLRRKVVDTGVKLFFGRSRTLWSVPTGKSPETSGKPLGHLTNEESPKHTRFYRRKNIPGGTFRGTAGKFRGSETRLAKNLNRIASLWAPSGRTRGCRPLTPGAPRR